MEILIACLVATYVVKNGAIDAFYAARGKPSPRQVLASQVLEHRAAKVAAKSARPARPAPFRDYLRQLWNDGWEEQAERHARRLEKRRVRRAERERGIQPRGALRRYLRSVQDDAWAAWDKRWDKAQERRRQRRLDGSAEALAATLIARAEADANAARSADTEPDHPAPTLTRQSDAEQVPIEPRGPVDVVQIPDRAASPCAECSGTLTPVLGTVHVDEGNGSAMVDTRCGSCGLQSYHSWVLSGAEYERVLGHHFDDVDEAPECPVRPGMDFSCYGTGGRGHEPISLDSVGEPAGGPASAPGLATVHPLQSATQEGPEMAVTATGETTTLSQTLSTIQAWEASAQAAVASLETSIASLQAANVGPSVTGPLGQALEAFGQALAHFQGARAGLDPSVQIGDMYNSHPDAGDKEYVTS